ncbi:ankyrin repeat-containing protein [Lausannevirus]|uniref:Ankyrin repeat-containing protein n=2 Tax=Lausannevirus TaxID=999883 RepID=F2WL41_9VIRU|nr:ankyrin repeat-containing protein [Lausannevirus]AEA06964.1 ankyrin repeat-containing protein [Lausannevirus]
MKIFRNIFANIFSREGCCPLFARIVSIALEERKRLIHIYKIAKRKTRNVRSSLRRTCTNCQSKRTKTPLFLWLVMASHKYDTAALRGDFQSVRVYESLGVKCSKKALDWAAMEGHLDIVKFLCDKNKECSNEAVDQSATFGHLEVVKYLHGKNKPHTKAAMNGAARNGHEPVLRFLHCNSLVGCDERALDWAAEYGHIEAVRFLVFHRREGCTARAIIGATKNEHSQVVEFLMKQTVQKKSWLKKARASTKNVSMKQLLE